MARMATRLLGSFDIPSMLWRRDEETLLLPHTICRAYRGMLEAKGLISLAESGQCDDGPVGGINERDTQKHFATRFATSAARVQLAMLDPNDELQNASDLFVRALAGGALDCSTFPAGLVRPPSTYWP
jgi:hypothetical protein